MTAERVGSDMRPAVLNENGKVCLAFEPISPEALQTEHAWCVKLSKAKF